MMKSIKHLKTFYKIRRKKILNYPVLHNGNYGLFANTTSVFTSNQIQALKKVFRVIYRRNAKI
jgi:hypothetical protein